MSLMCPLFGGGGQPRQTADTEATKPSNIHRQTKPWIPGSWLWLSYHHGCWLLVGWWLVGCCLFVVCCRVLPGHPISTKAPNSGDKSDTHTQRTHVVLSVGGYWMSRWLVFETWFLYLRELILINFRTDQSSIPCFFTFRRCLSYLRRLCSHYSLTFGLPKQIADTGATRHTSKTQYFQVILLVFWKAKSSFLTCSWKMLIFQWFLMQFSKNVLCFIDFLHVFAPSCLDGSR